ncbi:MAG: HD domain-containing protein [Treponema sp.]|jgi:poly(A) polymerase|nr:HD domain-containing protein [Treponema sp.]
MDKNPKASPAVCSALREGGCSFRFRGISALDRYFGLADLPFVFVETSADLQTLARLFGELRFPGPELADCAVSGGGRDWYFFCAGADAAENRFSDGFEPGASFGILDFFLDPQTGRYFDPFGVYPLLRRMRRRVPEDILRRNRGFSAERNRFLLDAALILSRYAPFLSASTEICAEAEALDAERPGTELQRIMLTAILLSPGPDRGLELLRAAGFLADNWPELAQLDDAEHSKEFHPEGNAWKHTLETFRYRKASGPDSAGSLHDIRLSLGLLLHDTGKPLALSSGRNRFDGHAEIGAAAARRFLDRLEFPSELINDVCYLVKNHMLPAALPRLPLSRTKAIMDSRLFPVLLELYRCDESSSFKGLDQYYKSSAAYRRFLRLRKNPYRKEGKET